MGRGRVKTRAEYGVLKKRPSDRTVLAWQQLGMGKTTPENRVRLRFHTASVVKTHPLTAGSAIRRRTLLLPNVGYGADLPSLRHQRG